MPVGSRPVEVEEDKLVESGSELFFVSSIMSSSLVDWWDQMEEEIISYEEQERERLSKDMPNIEDALSSQGIEAEPVCWLTSSLLS